MNKEKPNELSESLRFKVSIFSALTGFLYGLLTFFIFGAFGSGESTTDSAGLHFGFCIFGAFGLSLIIYHSILIRQLALPGAILCAIYLYIGYSGNEQNLFLFICYFIMITTLALGIVESKYTTGNISDFWRSFLYHPLGWAKHFKIKTKFE